MTGREKPKRKALHRGLDDIVNRDASLTSKLLGRVKAPAREPLEVPPDIEASREVAESDNPGTTVARTQTEATRSAPQMRPRAEIQPAAVVRRIVDARSAVPPVNAANTTSAAVEKESSERPVADGHTFTPPMTFDEFVSRWEFVLRSGGRAGKLRICQVLYENTFGAGRDTFFTSYEKLAKLTGLEKKQCAINVKQLEGLGFIERLNIYNTATRQGTEFKLHLEQLPPHARRVPRHHNYDEDVP
jgi:hypothetical protein